MQRKMWTAVVAVGLASALLGTPAQAGTGPGAAQAGAQPRAHTSKAVPLSADEQISRSVVQPTVGCR